MSDPYQFGDLMLLSGTGNPELSEKIAREIDLPLAKMDITRFADGEFDVKIAESVRGRDVFLIQPTCQPVSDNLVQLFVEVDDVDAYIAKATSLGAKVIVPKSELPDGDALAIVLDPVGLSFGLYRPKK